VLADKGHVMCWFVLHPEKKNTKKLREDTIRGMPATTQFRICLFLVCYQRQEEYNIKKYNFTRYFG
jgi:hypothetical protein